MYLGSIFYNNAHVQRGCDKIHLHLLFSGEEVGLLKDTKCESVDSREGI